MLMTYLGLKVGPTYQTMWMVWDYRLNLFVNLIIYYNIYFVIYFQMILVDLLELISDFSRLN